VIAALDVALYAVVERVIADAQSSNALATVLCAVLYCTSLVAIHSSDSIAGAAHKPHHCSFMQH
jgi:hypothetical protein